MSGTRRRGPWVSQPDALDNLVSYSKGFYRHPQKQLKSVLCLENTLISYLNSCKKAHEKAEKGFEIGDFSVQSLKS